MLGYLLDCIVRGTKVKVTDVGFVIGGSGITPAYQVSYYTIFLVNFEKIMQEIYKDKEDKTRAHLLFANRAEVSMDMGYC